MNSSFVVDLITILICQYIFIRTKNAKNLVFTNIRDLLNVLNEIYISLNVARSILVTKFQGIKGLVSQDLELLGFCKHALKSPLLTCPCTLPLPALSFFHKRTYIIHYK